MKTWNRTQPNAHYRAVVRLVAASMLAGTRCVLAADAPTPAAAVTNNAEISLDALANVQVKIASINAKPVVAQPAVVSVITAQEIEATGAKDLKDILQQVPGFNFGYNEEMQVGTGFRGFWAYEGKVQVLVDGVEMNEGLYGTLVPLDHYSAANIQQVEILRGPGSAAYGGTSDLGVISITTKGAEQNGGSVSDRVLFNGQTPSDLLNASFGYQLTNNWRVSGSFYYADTALSDQTYVAQDGTKVNLKDHSADNPMELNLAGGSKDFDLRVIYDRFHNQDALFDGLHLPTRPYEFVDDTLAVAAKYELKPTDYLTITPKVTYKYEQPWEEYGGDGNGDFSIEYERWTFDLPTVVHINDQSSVVVGARYYREQATADNVTSVGYPSPANYFNGSDHIIYDDYAAYGQYDLDTKWVNVMVGGRYENQSYAGGQFVPEVGVVKTWDRFHVKLLYNQASRTPNIEVVQQRVDPSTNIKSESTTSYEVEAGYQFAGGFSFVGDLYYMQVKDLIGWNGAGYANGGPVSTEGAESELRYTAKKLSASLGYAFSRATEQGVAYYAGPDHLNLNMPAHQVTLSTTWHVTDAVDWNVSGVFYSERAAYYYPNVNSPGELPAEFLLNTYAEYRWRGFSFGVGIRDLLGEEQLGQGYNGGGMVLKPLGRTFFAQVGCKF